MDWASNQWEQGHMLPCVSEFKRLKKSVLSNLGQTAPHKSTINNVHIMDFWVWNQPNHGIVRCPGCSGRVTSKALLKDCQGTFWKKSKHRQICVGLGKFKYKSLHLTFLIWTWSPWKPLFPKRMQWNYYETAKHLVLTAADKNKKLIKSPEQRLKLYICNQVHLQSSSQGLSLKSDRDQFCARW